MGVARETSADIAKPEGIIYMPIDNIMLMMLCLNGNSGSFDAMEVQISWHD